jgi:hypothetical protein
MFTHARAAWRLGATAAITAAALSLVASAAWATTHSGKATTVSVCSASELGAWVAADQGQGAAGTLYVPLEFTNVSSQACTLDGYPGVSAITASDVQLGNSAGWDTAVKPAKVTLAAGATAYALLEYSDVLTSDCTPAKDQITSYELKVYPPGDKTADDAFFDFPTCAVTGFQGDFLRVRSIAAGPGNRNSTG